MWRKPRAPLISARTQAAKRLHPDTIPCEMSNFETVAFTDKCLERYDAFLRQHLPTVKFMLDRKGAVKQAITDRVFRVIGDFKPLVINLTLDQYMRKADGTFDLEMLAGIVAESLAGPVIHGAEIELKPTEENAFKRIGAGQLWVLHEVIPRPLTMPNGPTHHFASNDHVGLIGTSWYDLEYMKNVFTSKISWALARSGEIPKEALVP